MARFLYQYRNPQILMMEQAEARRVKNSDSGKLSGDGLTTKPGNTDDMT
jgi:hypothetical protein